MLLCYASCLFCIGQFQNQVWTLHWLYRLVKTHHFINRSNFYEGRDLFQPESYQGFEPNVELLTDIRNFLAFQNSSAGDGEGTTAAIVEHFKEKLPPSKTPLFKALLTEICTFQKPFNLPHNSNSSQKGVWRLKDEFRWALIM